MLNHHRALQGIGETHGFPRLEPLPAGFRQPSPQPEKRGAREGSSREVVNPGPQRERLGHLGAIGRAAGGGQAPLQHHEQLRPARPDGAAARRLRGCRLHLGLPAAAGNGGAAREWEHEGCPGGGRERRP